MEDSVSITRIKGDKAIFVLSSLLSDQRILRNMDDRMQTLYGIYLALKDVEQDLFRVYCFTYKEEILGCVVGNEHNGYFIGHYFFRLHPKANVSKICNPLPKIIQKDYEKDGIKIHSMLGQIPETNHACIRVCKRLGGVDIGIQKDVEFIENGKLIPCRGILLKLEN